MERVGNQNHQVTLFCETTACDVPGIKKLLPQPWREWEFFDNIYKLVGVPVVTVQLRFNGWVTEMKDIELSRYV
jgi:zeta-carotene desaturase